MVDANGDGIRTGHPAFAAVKVWLDVNSNAHTGAASSLPRRTGNYRHRLPHRHPDDRGQRGNAHPSPRSTCCRRARARASPAMGGTRSNCRTGIAPSIYEPAIVAFRCPPSPSVQEELARHTGNMSREAQGLFGGNAALLTGLAVAQTAAAGMCPGRGQFWEILRSRPIPNRIFCILAQPTSPG